MAVAVEPDAMGGEALEHDDMASPRPFDPSTASFSSQAGRLAPVRILLVDDHAVIRQALRMLLASQPDIEVVGDVENGRDAVAAVGRAAPDVVSGGWPRARSSRA